MPAEELERTAEFEAKSLGDGWVEVRIVYRLSSRQHELVKSSGFQAGLDIANFVLSFAAGLARSMGWLVLDHSIGQLWDYFHERSGCPCGNHNTH